MFSAAGNIIQTMDKICSTLFLLMSVKFFDQIQARYDLAFILTVLLYRCYVLTIDDENKIDWLDLTILKESLTAALSLFLFFSTNFSIAVWICSWVSLSQVTRLFPFDCFVLVRAHFTEFYTDVYIVSSTVRERGSRWYNDSMLGTSSDKLIPKMLVSQIKNDQALLTLYRERWLKSSGP